MEIVRDVIEGKVKEWIDEGLSSDEISSRIDSLPIEEMYRQIVDGGSKDLLNTLQQQVFEISAQHRVDTNLFLAHHASIWNRCFAFSEAQYVLTLEIAEDYRKDVEAETDTNSFEEKKYSYWALTNIHGRACQVYLEVLCLVENGFADGAFARWRTLYELGIIGDFIHSYGEPVAKAFLEQANTDDQHYTWARCASCFEGKKPNFRVRFSDIENIVSKEPRWKESYKTACFVMHGSPQGTLRRIGAMDIETNVINAGRTDYGIDSAAINASSLFALITITYLELFPSEDSIRNALFLSLWANAVRDNYKEVANTAFTPDNDGKYHTRVNGVEKVI